jgi:hypothetical protein
MAGRRVGVPAGGLESRPVTGPTETDEAAAHCPPPLPLPPQLVPSFHYRGSPYSVSACTGTRYRLQ